MKVVVPSDVVEKEGQRLMPSFCMDVSSIGAAPSDVMSTERDGTSERPRERKRGPRKPPDEGSLLEPVKETARRTGIPYETWRKLAFNGEIPVVKIGGDAKGRHAAWFFRRADVDALIKRKTERLNAA